MQAVNTRHSTISSHAGSLNTFGTGLFIEQFLSFWQKEGFPDYIMPTNHRMDNSINNISIGSEVIYIYIYIYIYNVYVLYAIYKV